MSSQSLVVLGRLTRPHGIRGEMCAAYYAESFDYLKKPYILLRAGKSIPRECVIKSWRPKGNDLILKIEGVDTRNDSELLRNHEIVMDEKYLTPSTFESLSQAADTSTEQKKLTHGQEPYLRHILGALAFLADGKNLGVIKDIIFPAGQEIWVIEHDSGAEILFPAVSSFVERYDLEHGKIYLNPPEGLVDLYLEVEKK